MRLNIFWKIKRRENKISKVFSKDFRKVRKNDISVS